MHVGTVGEKVGDSVGENVGDAVGERVGVDVGDRVGISAARFCPNGGAGYARVRRWKADF